MKSTAYRKRFYRDWVRAGKLRECRLSVMETDLHILTDKPVDEDYAVSLVKRCRGQVEDYISRRSAFLTSLKPVAVEKTAPPLVRQMAAQAARANVGPMASVAGAIAGYVGGGLLRKGCSEVIVENGGDVFLRTRSEARVGLYAGSSKFSRRLSLVISPGQTPLGVCTSSGTVGHSLSFGSADSVTVLARDAALADACATAVCNRVSSEDDLPDAISFARSVRGIRGVLIVFRDTLATWGEITLE